MEPLIAARMDDSAERAGARAAGDLRAPLAYHQERIWFIDEFERDRVYTGPPAYHNIPVLLWIDGAVDPAALEAALDALVARHQALRTNIEEGRQRVRAAARVPLPVVERSWPEQDAIQVALSDSRRPFRLDRDLLFRAALYRESPARSLLALTIHHAVADLRSTQIVTEELVELLRAQVEGGKARLLPVPGFAAYAAWQRALPDAAFEPALRFWRWQLRGGPMPLDLPWKRPRHPIHVYAPAVCDVELGLEIVGALAGLAGLHEATLADVVLAGFVAALYACSRQQEIVVGTSHPNRDAAVERMVGPLANLLVLRFDVRPDRPFAELLRQVSRVARQAALHRAIPFDRLVHALNPPKDMSRTALFDVLFQYLEPEPRAWRVPALTIARAPAAGGFGKYDLNLTLQPDGSRVAGRIEYNAELFDADFVAELVALFEAALAGAARDIAAPVARHLALPAASVGRQRRLLRAEPCPRPAHSTIDAAFEAVVERSADRVAIVAGDVQVSFERLARDARRIARALVVEGVGPGTPVAVFLERSPEAIAAILGVLRAGAMYVPVDPAYPAFRVALLLEDSGAAVAVTRAALADRLREQGGGALRVIEVERCASLSPAPLRSRAVEGDVAYSIYTSGSTGRPKGCLVTHRSVVELILGQSAAFRFGQDDVWTWAHSICFDFSVWEIFGTLLHGARGVLLSHEAVRDPGLLQQALAREEVTVLDQTPAAGYRLVERLLESAAETPSLRWLIFGGDMLAPKRLAAWSARNPHVGVVNMYGITETTVHVTRKHLAPDDVACDSRSVGRALPNAATYVLDERGELLPLGVVGEIGVTGSGVCLGYWRRPGLTAERFVPDPFDEAGGGRMYRSGDTGRVRRNGELEFHGRRDNQVKVRGHRVELGEIEAALADHPGVREAAVIAREDAAGERMLAAFVVPAAGEVDVDALRAHLRARLTSAMLPRVIQPIGGLPRTATGKVDRSALAEVALAPSIAPRGYAPPRGVPEETLVRIWEEVLGRRPIGVADNFFEIGGDSILSIQICARAARAGLTLSPKQIFEHPTIEALAKSVGAAPVSPAAAPLSRAPLLPAQAWFFAERQPEPNHFNQSAWFELGLGLTAEDVRCALNRLRARHEALRLVFVEDAEGVHQQVREPSGEVPLEIVRVEGEEEREAVERVARAVERAQRGLDIQNGPLFRCVYVDRGPASPPRILLVFHHLVVDGVSWRIIHDELDCLLERRGSAEPVVLPEAGSLLRSALQAAATRPAAEAGEETGVDPVAARLPLDFDAGLEENTFGRYAEVETTLDEEATVAIAASLGAGKLGVEDALVAAAGRAVLEWAGGECVDLYVESHGRDLSADAPADARTVGWFTQLHRVRLPRAGASPSADVRAARTALGRARSGPSLFAAVACATGDAPWAGLKAGAYRHRRIGADTGAPGVCVNYLGQVNAGAGAGRPRQLTLIHGDTGAPIGPRNRRAHLVDVHARVQDGRLHVRWGFCAAIHRPQTIERLAAACLAFLERLRAEAVRPEPASSAAGEPVELFPLGPGQLGMFYHALLRQAGAPEYVIRSMLEIRGALDVPSLRASWSLLVERHDALRASFTYDGAEGARQRFDTHVELPWREHDWRSVDRADVGQRLDALAAGVAGRPLDLSRPPLLSVDLVRAGDHEYYVLLQIHHLIVDGWSMPILRDELLRAYEALSAGAEVRLPGPGRFRDYLRDRERMPPQPAREFWSRHLRGARACTIAPPAGRHAEPGGVFESGSVDAVDLPLAPERGWARWAAAHRLTTNTVVQAVWGLVLASMTGRDDVVTGIVVAGRPAAVPGVERTVGSFINIVPLRARVPAAGRLASWCQAIQREFSEGQALGDWPLPDVCAWAGLPRDQPLFDTVLVCQNYPAGPERLGALAVREIRYSLKEAVPLVLEYSLGSRIAGRCRYRADLVSAATVEDAGGLLQAGLEAIDREGDLTVEALMALLAGDAARRRQRRQHEFAAARRNLLRRATSTGTQATS